MYSSWWVTRSASDCYQESAHCATNERNIFLSKMLSNIFCLVTRELEEACPFPCQREFHSTAYLFRALQDRSLVLLDNPASSSRIRFEALACSSRDECHAQYHGNAQFCERARHKSTYGQTDGPEWNRSPALSCALQLARY